MILTPRLTRTETLETLQTRRGPRRPFRMKVVFGAFVVLVGVYTIVEAFLTRTAA